MTEDKYSMILTTCKTEKQADLIISILLEKKLAACIQTQNICSYYTWKGEQQRSFETLLTIKTRTELFSQVEECIISHHSYETPEVIRVPISDGSKAYFNWIDEVTK